MRQGTPQKSSTYYKMQPPVAGKIQKLKPTLQHRKAQSEASVESLDCGIQSLKNNVKTLECKYKDLVQTRPQLPQTIEELLNRYSDRLELSPIQQLFFDELRNDLHSFIPTS